MKTLLGVIAMVAMVSIPALSQKVSGSSATTVSAEMTKGKLNPAESKPGDQVTLKLKDDVKSNGEVVLKKGTSITGVVRNVKHVEGKGTASGQAQSLMEIEWLAPSAQGGASQQLMLAVQSVTQVSPAYRTRQESDSDWALMSGPSAAGGGAVRSSAGRGGLLGGAVGGALGGTAGVAGATAGVAGGALETTAGTALRTNAAMLSMPTVVAADAQTATSLENNLGMSSSGELFHTGHGEIVTAGGSHESLDIFSHMTNDTVLTSPSKNFEISSGAQMQLLVGVRKN